MLLLPLPWPKCAQQLADFSWWFSGGETIAHNSNGIFTEIFAFVCVCFFLFQIKNESVMIGSPLSFETESVKSHIALLRIFDAKQKEQKMSCFNLKKWNKKKRTSNQNEWMNRKIGGKTHYWRNTMLIIAVYYFVFVFFSSSIFPSFSLQISIHTSTFKHWPNTNFYYGAISTEDSTLTKRTVHEISFYFFSVFFYVRDRKSVMTFRRQIQWKNVSEYECFGAFCLWFRMAVSVCVRVCVCESESVELYWGATTDRVHCYSALLLLLLLLSLHSDTIWACSRTHSHTYRNRCRTHTIKHRSLLLAASICVCDAKLVHTLNRTFGWNRLTPSQR